MGENCHAFSAILLLVLISAAFLVPVHGQEGEIERIYIAPMTHLDIGFTGTQRRIAQSYTRIVDNALDQLDRYPEYRWTVENFWQLQQWMERTEGRELDRLLEYVRQGRVEISGSYVNVHTGFMAGETFYRFLYPSLRFANSHGFSIDTVVQNDVPGFSRDLPGLLAGAGIDYFVAGVNDVYGGGMKLGPGDNPFYWKAPDGERVLTWVSDSERFKGYWGGLEMFWGEWLAGAPFPKQIEELISELEREGYPYDAVMLIRAVDNEAPSAPALFEGIEEWEKSHDVDLVVATPSEFMSYMEEKYGDQFPTFSGEWSRWESNKAGSPVTSARTRWLHENLPALETISSLMGLTSEGGSVSVPSNDLNDIYESTLVADGHASHGQPSWPGKLAGRQLDEINETVVRVSKEAVEKAKDLVEGQLGAFFEGFNGHSPRIVVVSASSLERDRLVRVMVPGAVVENKPELIDLANNSEVPYEIKEVTDPAACTNPWSNCDDDDDEVRTHEILFVGKDLPQFGYKVYELTQEGTGKEIEVSEKSVKGEQIIENEYYRVTVSKEGYLKSIFDKEEELEVLNGDSGYSLGRVYLGYHNDLFKPSFHGEEMEQTVINIERTSGQVSKSVQITYGAGPLRELKITLYKGQDWVDVSATVDRSKIPHVPYAEHSANLYLTFPLTSVEGATVEGVETFYEEDDFMPGAKTGRTKSRGIVAFTVNSDASIAVAHRQSFLSTMAGKHNRMTGGAPPRLPSEHPVWVDTLLKEFDETKAMEGVISFDPEPNTEDIIAYQYRIAVTENDRADLTALRRSYLAPPFTLFLPGGGDDQGVKTERSFLQLWGPCELLTMKKSEDSSGYAVRLKNLTEGDATCSLDFSTPSLDIYMTDGYEREKSLMVAGGNRVVLEPAPNEILTLKVEP